MLNIAMENVLNAMIVFINREIADVGRVFDELSAGLSVKPDKAKTAVSLLNGVNRRLVRVTENASSVLSEAEFACQGNQANLDRITNRYFAVMETVAQANLELGKTMRLLAERRVGQSVRVMVTPPVIATSRGRRSYITH